MTGTSQLRNVLVLEALMVGGSARWGIQMVLSNREYVGRALETLATGLEPHIARILSRVAPGVAWTKILQHKDENAGRSAQSYSPIDLSVQLRVMTEALGSLGYPFDMGHEARSYASELRQVRNLWAHNESFNDGDTYRALDTADRFAKYFRLEEAVQPLSELLETYKGRNSVSDEEATPAGDINDKLADNAATEVLSPAETVEEPLTQHKVQVEVTASRASLRAI